MLKVGSKGATPVVGDTQIRTPSTSDAQAKAVRPDRMENRASQGAAAAAIWPMPPPSQLRMPSEAVFSCSPQILAQKPHAELDNLLADLRTKNLDANRMADAESRIQAAKKTKHQLGKTLLHAMKGGEAETLRQLVAAGADVNTSGDDGRTPLMLAVKGRKEANVKILLAAPEIDVNREDGAHESALILAVKNEDRKILRQLLSVPEIDTKDVANFGPKALEVAMDHPDLKLLQLLLKIPGFPVNVRNSDGDTALITAADADDDDNEELLAALLGAEGIDVNARGKAGDTALMRAIASGYSEYASILLKDPRVDVNARNEKRTTPLMMALTRDDEESVEQLLSREGIKVNRQSENGETALSLAATKREPKYLEQMLSARDINLNRVSRNEESPTPLLSAIQNGDTQFAGQLIARGADPNFLNGLALAAKKGNEEMVSLLLRSKASLNPEQVHPSSPTTHIKTPLMWAVAGDHVNLVRTLLAAGANPAATFKGKTARQLTHNKEIKTLIDRAEKKDRPS